MTYPQEQADQLTYDAVRQCWVITRYRLGTEALHHPLLTTRPPEADAIVQDPTDPMGLIFQQSMLHDGARHLPIRTLLEAAIKRRVGQMQPLVHRLIPALFYQAASQPRDSERTFAAPLPMLSLAHLLGLYMLEGLMGDGLSGQPDALALLQARLTPVLTKLTHWQRGLDAFGDLMTGYPTLAAIKGAERLQQDVRQVLAEKRHQPEDDLGTLCARAPEFSSEEERIGNFIMLFGAGSGTTTTLLLNGPVLLLQQPEQFAQMRTALEEYPKRETSLLRNLEEELLRLVTPTQTVARWTLEDMSLGGHTLRRGSKVVLDLAAMNRDPAIFPEPDQFDPGRRNARDHLAFGAGHHGCPGRPLALLEILEVLKYLFSLRNLRLAPGQQLSYGYNANQRRLKQALIEWDT